MSAAEQDSAFQCAQGTEGQRRKETVSEILEIVTVTCLFPKILYQAIQWAHNYPVPRVVNFAFGQRGSDIGGT